MALVIENPLRDRWLIGAGNVGPEEIPTLMRYLGAYPTEKAMTKDILPDMQASTYASRFFVAHQLAATCIKT